MRMMVCWKEYFLSKHSYPGSSLTVCDTTQLVGFFAASTLTQEVNFKFSHFFSQSVVISVMNSKLHVAPRWCIISKN